MFTSIVEPREVLRLDFESYLRTKAQASTIFSSADLYAFLDRGIAGEFNNLYRNKESQYHSYKPVFKVAMKKILHSISVTANGISKHKTKAW